MTANNKEDKYYRWIEFAKLVLNYKIDWSLLSSSFTLSYISNTETNRKSQSRAQQLTGLLELLKIQGDGSKYIVICWV